ncbi:hypothetical protein ACP70R_028978 [Stipagrostis hirtigluma subsp. patula]
METNSVSAVAACMIILLLLSPQPLQVAAMSKFCQCYVKCYPACREDNNRQFFCKISCSVRCAVVPKAASALLSPAATVGGSAWPPTAAA